MNKYHAIKTAVRSPDGTIQQFDSRKELARWQDLSLLMMAGQISGLRRQVEYELIPAQKRADGSTERACKYVADFVYARNGKTVVEDVKGTRTRDYIIKRKLMLLVHGITVSEI